MLSFRTTLSILLLASPGLAHDDCSTAVVLDPCGGDGFDFEGFDLQGRSTSCGPFPSAWTRMTPSRSGPLTVYDIDNATRVEVFSGSCGSLTSLECGISPLTFLAVEGTTYFFKSESLFAARPNVRVSVVDPNCVANDGSECLQAVPLDSCGGQMVRYDTSNGSALQEGMPSDCLLIEGDNTPSQWFEIVPAADDVLTVSFIVDNPNFGFTAMNVYEGDCSSLLLVDCAPIDGGVTLPVVAGVRYTIQIFSIDNPSPEGTLTTSFLLGGAPCGPCADCDGDTYDMSVDCDDGNSDVYPGAPEIIGNGIDDDCDGIVDNCSDCDGDGYPVPADCDDTNPFVNPGAVEIQGNGIDDDCDGTVDEPGWQLPGPIRSPIRHY